MWTLHFLCLSPGMAFSRSSIACPAKSLTLRSVPVMPFTKPLPCNQASGKLKIAVGAFACGHECMLRVRSRYEWSVQIDGNAQQPMDPSIKR